MQDNDAQTRRATIDPSLVSGISAAFEAAINKALDYDPGTRNKANKLAGKSLQVNITDLEVNAQLTFFESSIGLSCAQTATTGPAHQSNNHDASDVRICGRSMNLLAIGINHNTSLADTGVKAQGDLGFLADIRELVATIDIDFEDALAPHIGQVSASLVGSVAKQYYSAVKTTAHSSISQAEAFIQNEMRLLPTKNEFDNFKIDVSSARMATERLQAKIESFINQHNQTKETRE